MQVFSQRIRHRARILGLSDAEVARRAGLTERRYGNYVAGIREPDLATVVKIAAALSTTPNHLLGVEPDTAPKSDRERFTARLLGAVNALTTDDLERVTVQVEALARHRVRRRRR